MDIASFPDAKKHRYKLKKFQPKKVGKARGCIHSFYHEIMDMMNKHTVAIGKAFAINQDTSIYGTFAEIGAGQETVNHFFKAGLASQTVAKSMSAYDMTFSDEIYGRQNRYVSKDRLITMLDHEYKLLQKRLKKSLGGKTRFFTFANTAMTGGTKKQLSHPHSWMGIRFQTKPLGPANDIIFHVECRDNNRLKQYETLGVLGVNLIYACFHFIKDYKKFIVSLTDHLHKPRIEINGLTFSGPDLQHFNEAKMNRELIHQGLAQTAFFNSKGQSELITDAIFEKPLLIFYKSTKDKRNFRKEREIILKKKLFKKTPSSIVFLHADLLTETSLPQLVREFCKDDFCFLISSAPNLGELKQILRNRYYNNKKLVFVISKDHFLQKLFHPSPLIRESVLEKAGKLFDKKTYVQVLSKSEMVRPHSFTHKELNLLRDYLVITKQIEDL